MKSRADVHKDKVSQQTEIRASSAESKTEIQSAFMDARPEMAQLMATQVQMDDSQRQQALMASQLKAQNSPNSQKARFTDSRTGQTNSSSQKSSQSSMLSRAAAGQLGSEEVQISSLETNLSESELQSLQSSISSIDNPTATPVMNSLQNGTAEIRGERIVTSGLQSAEPAQLAGAIHALGPKKAEVQIRGNEYRVMAKVNPWLQIANGKITQVDTGPINKHMGAGWIWVYAQDLTKAKLTSHNAVGKSWPPTSSAPSTTSSSSYSVPSTSVPSTTSSSPYSVPSTSAPSSTSSNPYSVPSTTFSNLSLPSSFHSLTADQLPPTMNGYAYNFDSTTSEWGLYRDPVVVPSSPLHGIDAEETGGRLHYSSYEEDPQNKGETRVTGAYSQTAAKGSGYGGVRDYPMDSSDYVDSSGTSWDRGHAVDHFDGSYASTTSANNYVPENSHFNRGARNHKVQELRRNGGGSYQATYSYGPNPPRVHDGTPIPETEHFTTYSLASVPSYYQVPNMAYPPSNKKATVDQFMQPHSNAPKSTYF